MKQFAQSEQKIFDYAVKTFNPEDSILEEIRERSQTKGLPAIQVGSMDGLHLELLTRAAGASKAVEIGTLGGYSGVCIARGLRANGKLYTFEYDPRHAAVAEESFKKADVLDRVEIFVGPALDNLPKIEAQGPFDLVFIDADKQNYTNYFNWADKNLRVGGVVLADNTFAWGMIADQKFEDPADAKTVKALQAFNQAISVHSNFRSTILPTGEGLTMGVKIK